MLTGLRQVARALLKTPGFTAVAVVSIAVGIGVNTAMFSVLDGLFMRPIPGVDTDGLVRLSPGDAASVGPGGFPWADYPEFRQQCRTMEVSASTGHGARVTGPAGPEFVSANVVSWNYFTVLRLQPAAGRFFAEADDVPGAEPVVVIINEALAHRGWAGRNPVGGLIRLRERTDSGVEVVGVVHDGQEDPGGERVPLDVYLPYRQQPPTEMILLAEIKGKAENLVPGISQAVHDLHPGVAVRQADTFTHASRLKALREATLLMPLAVLGALAFAMAVAGLYGLISWSVARRTQEIGIRMAMGAQRRDTLWLVLKQGLWLATGGVLIGVPAAAAIAQTMWSFVPIMRSAFFVAAPLAVLTVVGVVLLASYVPARRAARVDPMTALRTE